MFLLVLQSKKNMLILLSPTKNFDFETNIQTKVSTEPIFIEKAKIIIEKLKTFSAKDLEKLMKISSEIAIENVERNHNWNSKNTKNISKQAIFAYSGLVFQRLNSKNFDDNDLDFAQRHLRILSALYGVLRHFDTIQSYRLEMQTKFEIENYKNLYKFWENSITVALNQELKKYDFMINLASNEYFKTLIKSQIKAQIITPIFKQYSKGEYKILTVYAKEARGLMTNFIIKNKITTPENLKLFDSDGYFFDVKTSDENNFVFLKN
jgi:cytoplasmic iron level regulating protein YaaA (DUF328/UPF0246 family)